MATILSLDLGITSCGYSAVKQTDTHRYDLLDYGVILRDPPKEQKTRREYKSKRKILKQRKKRIKALKELFSKYNLNLLPPTHFVDIWQIRGSTYKKRLLTNDELFALLRYFLKHRGYKSLSVEELLKEIELKKQFDDCEAVKFEKAEFNEEEFSKAVVYFDALLCKNPNKTAGEIVYELNKDATYPIFRNHDNFRFVIKREHIAKEARTILQKQIELGLKVDNAFIATIENLITYQDPVVLDTSVFGKCSLYKQNPVAPKFCYSFDLFTIYKYINDLVIDKQKISYEQTQTLKEFFLTKIQTNEIKEKYYISDIKKALGISDEKIKLNNTQDYRTIKGKKEKNIALKLPFLSSLKKLHKEFLEQLSPKLFDELALIIHQNINPHLLLSEAIKLLKQNGIEGSDDFFQENILTLYKHKIKTTANYSIEALQDLITLMQERKNESEALEILGVAKGEDYSTYPKGLKYLKPLDKDATLQYELDEGKITNFKVKSLVQFALRLIFDLHRKFGPFDTIKLESTRELSQSQKVKNTIEKAQQQNQKEWEDIKKRYAKHLQNKNKNNKEHILKLKLYEQQNFRGIYSLKSMGVEDVLSEKTQIEHIVPQAAGGLSTFYNLSLDFADVNQQKSNRLPLEFLQGEDQERFLAFVNELKNEGKINFKKYKNLTAKSLDDIYTEVRHDRALHATSYAEKLLGEMLKRYYPFSSLVAQNKRVLHISGRATNYLRALLHIDDKSRDTNFHHAEDAILISLMSEAYLKQISDAFRKGYKRHSIKEILSTITPLINGAKAHEVFETIRRSFHKEIETNHFYDVFGTKKLPIYWVDKKPIGTEVHKETIQSKKELNPYFVKVHTLFDALTIKYDTPIEKFSTQYDKNVLDKLYVYHKNLKDFIAQQFIEKKKKIIASLQQANFATSKEEQATFNKQLKTLLYEPIFHANGMPIRRVKRVGEKVAFNVRGGVSAVAPSMVAMECSVVTPTRLDLKRIDMANKNNLHKDDPNILTTYNNDMIEIYIYKKKEIHHKISGIFRTFVEKANGSKELKVKNPKLPIAEKFQPKQYNSYIAVKTMCGIKKYKTDASGTVLGYHYIGSIIENDQMLFSQKVAYRSLR